MPRKQLPAPSEEATKTSATIHIPDLNTITPQMSDVRKMIDRAISEEDWIAIFDKFKSMALGGDRKAAEFLAKYRFGLPAAMGNSSDKTATGVLIVEVHKTDVSREDQEAQVVEGHAVEVE